MDLTKKLKQGTNAIFDVLGYRLVSSRSFSEALVEKDMGEIYPRCQTYTMTSKERMYALYKAVEYIVRARIPGDLVECGVWRGGSAMMMAYTLQKFGDTSRKIYLYDTYTGMSQPTEADVSQGVSVIDVWRQRQKGEVNEWCFASLQDVQANMASTGYPADQLVYVKGKVEDTIPQTIPESIALLRLDTDWYESTKHELCHLYPRVSQGGVLIIDDYGSWPGARKAVDEYFAGRPILLQRIDPSGRLAMKVS